ncbi:MAG: hypothetical protein LUC35_03735 [Clostridiales bacterium]|nr:hypothetical protein [Clostridiales bacterium]
MKILRLIDDKLEEVLMVLLLIGIVVFMSAQVISRRVFNNSALHIPMYCIQSSPLVVFLLLLFRACQAWVESLRLALKGGVEA